MLKRDTCIRYIVIVQEKKDLIIKLYLEQRSQAEITHLAKCSFTTVVKVIKEYENSKIKSKETLAFDMFKQGFGLLDVKSELDISGENAAKYFLAFNKLVGVGDLFHIYKELGTSISDLVWFYKESKLRNLTLANMVYALNLASNISTLEQQVTSHQNALQDSRRSIDVAQRSLSEVQSQTILTNRSVFAMTQEVHRLQDQIRTLNSVLEKTKNLEDYQKIEDIIHKTVNSITADQYLTIEVALMAVIKTIQKDAKLIPVILTWLPEVNYGDLDPTLRQSFLASLVSQAIEFMPKVSDELVALTGKNVLPNLAIMEKSFSQDEIQKEYDNPQLSPDHRCEISTIVQPLSDESSPFHSRSNIMSDTPPGNNSQVKNAETYAAICQVLYSELVSYYDDFDLAWYCMY
jgi:hemoglobin-like flavoprotein